jgi:outer membrane protein assembly factor BamB
VGSDDDKLYALDGSTGAEKWSFTATGAVSSSPAVSSTGVVYVGSNDNNIYAIK